MRGDLMDWLGDPDAVGIVTTLGYLTASGICFVVSRQMAPPTVGLIRHRAFWGALGALELLLGLNKQADWHVAITGVLREWARNGGWYQDRRQLQIGFGVFVALAVVVILTIAWRSVKDWPSPYWVALIAIALQFGYVLMRIASFHHFDALLAMDWSELKLAWVLELSGVGLCLSAAMAMLGGGIAHADGRSN